MDQLEENVLKTIKKHELIKNGDTIVIGVSGGPDSVALLHILHNLQNELKIQLVVAHVHHGIREESTEEAQYVENLCKKMQIPVYITRIAVPELAKKQKIGLEEAGRIARYTYFREIQEKVHAQKIATAHNANDNCETVLMNLIRGCGMTGLKGIPIQREQIYIKPLLETTREEIETYCKTYHLEPRIDKSNQDTQYTRNKIRNQLLPLLAKEYNPNIIQTIHRLTTIVAQEQAYMQTITKEQFARICIQQTPKEIQIDAKKMQQMDTFSCALILRYAIEQIMGSTQGITKTHIDDIVQLIQNNKGNKYLTPNKHLKISLQHHQVTIEKMS